MASRERKKRKLTMRTMLEPDDEWIRLVARKNPTTLARYLKLLNLEFHKYKDAFRKYKDRTGVSHKKTDSFKLNNGWILAARKTLRILTKYMYEESFADKCEDNDLEFENKFIRTLDSVYRCMVKLNKGKYLKSVIRKLRECLTVLKSESVSQIVCYGLGRLSKSKSSQYQLALLICLLDDFRQDDFHQPLATYAYDPIFGPIDKMILQHFEINVIDKNEGGERVVHDDKITLMFMPHCHLYLVNSFLYANWESKKLSNCILLGNSISNFARKANYSADVKKLLKATKYLRRIAPCVIEYKLHNTNYAYAFTYLSIHIFSKSRLQDLSNTFWKYREKPKYSQLFCDFVPGE